MKLTLLANVNNFCFSDKSCLRNVHKIYTLRQFHQHFTRNFLYKIALRLLSLVTFRLCNFLEQKYWRKILMKFTPRRWSRVATTGHYRIVQTEWQNACNLRPSYNPLQEPNFEKQKMVIRVKKKDIFEIVRWVSFGI